MSEEQRSLEMELVWEHYELMLPRGGSPKTRCPTIDHDDRHASASVNHRRGLWMCHGCGKSGSAIDLVMNREGMEYRDARQFVDALVGGSDSSVRGGAAGVGRGNGVSQKQGAGRERRSYRPSWASGQPGAWS